nr:MAG: hypothetical protein [Apis mellifera filamentous virus]
MYRQANMELKKKTTKQTEKQKITTKLIEKHRTSEPIPSPTQQPVNLNDRQTHLYNIRL